jgi:light-regulated signal transduction histidine kinase (bacteriophytochrome)
MQNKHFNILENLHYSKYEKQPIHIPSYIQAHGVLLAFKKPDIIIFQISENTNDFLGFPHNVYLAKT